MSSIASGRVSANSAVSSSGDSAAPSRALAIAPGTRSRRIGALLAPPRPAPRDEAPVPQLDHVEHALLEPLRVHVLRVDAEPLGERVAARRELLAHPVQRRERVLGRDVVAVRRQPAEVGGALLHERQPPVGEVRRDLDAHVGHQPAATRARARACRRARPVAPTRASAAAALRAVRARVLLRLVGDLGRLRAVVARVRHEVLEDHLLEVAVLRVHLRRAPPAPRRAPPASPRCPRGCRS